MRGEYEQERKEASRFLKLHHDHPGIRSARDWLGNWLDASASGDKDQVASVHMARLKRYAISPEAILAEVAALWVFAQRNPTTLPDDVRLTIALAIGVLFLCPRERTKTYHYRSGPRRVYADSTSTERRVLGEQLRKTLALLLLNITGAIEAQHAQHEAQRATFALPFSSNTQ
jgi:hypothetical protein